MVRPRFTFVASFAAAVLLVLAACISSDVDGSSSISQGSSPASEPPWGLDAAPLPETETDVSAVLAAMPTELDGMTGTIQGNEIDYGDSGMGEIAGSMETFLRVMTLGGEDFGTGAPFIEAIVQSGGIQVEGQELDPQAALVYVAGTTPAGEVDYASIMWANPDSRYVLLIQATSPEQRAALIEAYVDAATTLG
jgi:hypothetical protein